MYQRIGARVGACGRVGRHVAGCGGMWQGLMYVVGHQAYGIDRDMWQGWGHVVGSEDMWQVVEACSRGGGRVWGMWQG